MERTLAKIIQNSEQIKEACGAIHKVLSNIVDKDNEAVKEIKNLNDKEPSYSKKYLLSLLEFQYLAIQKLMEIDIELDEFTTQNQSLNLDIISRKSEQSLIAPSAFVCDKRTSPTTLPLNEELNKLPTEKNEEKNASKNKLDLSIVTLPSYSYETNTSSGNENTKPLTVPLTEICIPKTNVIELNKLPTDKSEEKNASKNKLDLSVVTLPSYSYDTNTSSAGENTKPLTVSSDEISIPKTEVILKNSEEILRDSNSESSSGSDKSDGKKSSADISSSEEVSQKTTVKKKSIQEKLKCKKLMTRRDRCLQNIERAEIPDLSFKPSSKSLNSNENYATCPESSSSTSATKLVERRRRKRRNVEPILTTPNATTSERGSACYKKPPEPHLNMPCLISHIVSPSEFYINCLDDNVALVDTISHQLAEIYAGTQCPFIDKQSAMESLTDNCVCYIDSCESWYRVTVRNWRLKARDYQEDLVSVFLVDYGHHKDTSYKNLRELSEEFCCVPQCAIKCNLAWLYPPSSTKEHLLENWPQKTLSYFVDLFTEYEKTVYKVVYLEKCGNSWGIDFTKLYDDNTTYGQLLLDNNMAVEIFQDPSTVFKNSFFLKQVTTAQGLAGISLGMDDGEKLAKFHDNIGENEHNNIDQAMLNYKAKDEARICKNARPDGTCFKGKRCKLEHGKLRPDGYTTDKQCVYVSAFTELILPEVNTTVKVTISNIITVNTFYAWIVSTQGEEANNLVKRMNKSDTVANYRPLEILPARAELVIAKSWNKKWYRAQVKDIYHYPQYSEETAQVFLVDLGETIDVKISNLRFMNPEFLDLPFQAVFCKLYNVKPKENQDFKAAKLYCESSFLGQIFDAEIQRVTPSTLEVLLKKHNNEDVGEQIIEEGYGELRTDHTYPSETLLVD